MNQTATANPPCVHSEAFEQEMVGRARELATVLAGRETQTLARRSVPPESIRDLRDAGLFKLLQPVRWGGYDAPHTVCARVVGELSKGCASTAWVYGILGVHNMMASCFGAQAQEELWGEDPQTLVSSSLVPKPALDTPDGGMRFNADLPFSSGCEHAGWAMVVGVSPLRGPMVGLVPMSELGIVDDWHVLGLRGTGSRTLQVRDVHVPAHRLASLMACMSGTRRESHDHPDSAWDTRPIGVFGVYNYACVVLGLAEKALEIATGLMKTPSPFGGIRGAMETLQMKFGKAASDIEMARFQLVERCRLFDRKMKQGGAFSDLEFLAHKRDTSQLVWSLRHAVEQLCEINNGWIYDRSPLQQVLRDIVTASGHRSANPEDNILPYAKAVLGL